jgi:purine-nucleoside phosphorylase
MRWGASAARAAAEAIRARVHDALGGEAPVAGIILGSGLGGLAGRIAGAVKVPYGEIPGFPESTVVGHAGALFAGTLAGRPVVALSGRFHMYEGHDASLAGFPARVLHALGAPVMIVSNAAGGLRRTFQAGDLMLIADHMNLMFRNPLSGAVEEGDTRFPDMSDPYDRGLRAIAREVAEGQGINLQEGVYIALLGPTYETPAEVRMFERLGGDAVGMSTVPEVIVAKAMGMQVLGISCITNLACGISMHPLSHEEVLETGARVASKFEGLIEGVVARLGLKSS